MAVIHLTALEDFLSILRREAINRYQLIKEIGEEGEKVRYILIPIVTSRHAHTYIYLVKNSEEEKQIEATWRGTIITASKVELNKW